MARIHSYVVRYDSGFAPNPFFGFCTLATCKADIRKSAQIGDWIVGSGSNDKDVRRGGHLVYAMRVTETMTFYDYNDDPRFQRKKPYRRGSRKQSCGDNIYFSDANDGVWSQRDSFHTQANGEIHAKHVEIDTSVNRVLISNDFVYFGGSGPTFPSELTGPDGRWICKAGIGRSCFDDQPMVDKLVKWIRSLNAVGYQGAPYEWISLRG